MSVPSGQKGGTVMSEYREEYRGFTLVVERDEDGQECNPREYDNLGRMLCWMRRHRIGDENPYPKLPDQCDSWEDIEKALRKLEDIAVILPVYAYVHGAITINTTGYSCPWDSGQVGFIFAAREDVLREYKVKRISRRVRALVAEVLRSEVAVYDLWLRGEVYYWALEDQAGEVVDSCCGYLGVDAAHQAAREAADWHAEH